MRIDGSKLELEKDLDENVYQGFSIMATTEGGKTATQAFNLKVCGKEEVAQVFQNFDSKFQTPESDLTYEASYLFKTSDSNCPISYTGLGINEDDPKTL